MDNEKLRNHIHRYFVAVHGPDYVFKAPEAFPNALERWMVYVTVAITDHENPEYPNKDAEALAEKEIQAIERYFKSPPV